MAILLGLLSAISFGSGDFFGGLSSKKASVIGVIAFSHLVGLIGVATYCFLFAEAFTWEALGVGAIAGAFGAGGLGYLYKGLSTGPMAVVATLTAITSAVVPALWGLVGGESLSVLAWIGILIALVAIAFTSIPSNATADGVTVKVVIESLVAGVGFGVFFIILDTTAADVAPWPVVGARLVTVIPLIPFVMITQSKELQVLRATSKTIVLTGVFDTLANVLFLAATVRGDLSIVAVLSSLYPVSTVILARTVLDEKISLLQLIGMVLALTATTFIALG